MNLHSPQPQEWLTSWDVWERFRITRYALYRAVKAGRLRIGHRNQKERNNTKCYYRVEDIYQWLQSHRKKSLAISRS